MWIAFVVAGLFAAWVLALSFRSLRFGFSIRRRLPVGDPDLLAQVLPGSLITWVNDHPEGITPLEALAELARLDPAIVDALVPLPDSVDTLASFWSYVNEALVARGEDANQSLFARIGAMGGLSASTSDADAGRVLTQLGFRTEGAGQEESSISLDDWMSVTPFAPVDRLPGGLRDWAFGVEGIESAGVTGMDAYVSPSELEAPEAPVWRKIPLVALSFSTARNIRAMARAEKTKGRVLGEIAVDTTGYGVGSLLGTNLGVQLGLLAMPVTGALSLPVFTVLGGWLGSLTGRKGGEKFKSRGVRQASERLEQELVRLGDSVREHREELFQRKWYPAVRAAIAASRLEALSQKEAALNPFWPPARSLWLRTVADELSREVRGVLDVLHLQERWMEEWMDADAWASVGKNLYFNRWWVAGWRDAELAAVDEALAEWQKERDSVF